MSVAASLPRLPAAPAAAQRRLAWLVVAGAAMAMLALAVFDPVRAGFFPPCPLWKLTGFYCPGCGSTRALYHLLHGHLGEALAFNPLAVLAAPFVGYGLLSRLHYLLRGRFLPAPFLSARLIYVLGITLVVFAVLRNLPWYPFHLLAPGAWLR